jgi:hypothetical protein
MRSPLPAAWGLIALVLVAAVVSFASTLSRWPADIATMYVVAHAADQLGASVYDYASLAQFNAAHHTVQGAIYPFTYPPFILLAVHPLTVLPFDAVRVLWAAIRVLAVLGAALLLADAFVASVERLEGRATALSAALRASSPMLGRWRVPALPFVIGAASLLLALPPVDARYWGAGSILIVLLVALELDGALRGRPVIAGCAAGLAAGLASPHPVFGLLIILGFIGLALFVPRAWRRFSVGALAALIVWYPPTAGLPGDLSRQYSAYLAQRTLLGGVYATSWHNGSLMGFMATLLSLGGHTGTQAFNQGERLATYLGWAVAILTALALMGLGFAAWRAQRDAKRSFSASAVWSALAMVTVAYALLSTPLWPFEAVMVAFATLLLLGAAVSDAGSRPFVARVTASAAVVALLFCIGATLSGSDWQDLPQGTSATALYLLRPLAALLVWAAVGFVLLTSALASVWRSRSSATLEGAPSRQRIAEPQAAASRSAGQRGSAKQ